jgi:hypothetical protein
MRTFFEWIRTSASDLQRQAQEWPSVAGTLRVLRVRRNGPAASPFAASASPVSLAAPDFVACRFATSGGRSLANNASAKTRTQMSTGIAASSSLRFHNR